MSSCCRPVEAFDPGWHCDCPLCGRFVQAFPGPKDGTAPKDVGHRHSCEEVSRGQLSIYSTYVRIQMVCRIYWLLHTVHALPLSIAMGVENYVHTTNSFSRVLFLQFFLEVVLIKHVVEEFAHTYVRTYVHTHGCLTNVGYHGWCPSGQSSKESFWALNW